MHMLALILPVCLAITIFALAMEIGREDDK